MKITSIEFLNGYYGDLFRQLATMKRFLTWREWVFMHAKLHWRYKRSYRLLRKFERIQDSALLNIVDPDLEAQERTKKAKTLKVTSENESKGTQSDCQGSREG